MTSNFKPYPSYKDSELPWLERIPAGWQLLRGKSIFGVVDIRSKTGREELLTVSASNGVIPRTQTTVTMFKAKSYIGHKLCWPGDLVVNSLWAWMQGLGVAQHHGLISSAYSVYRPRREFTDYARFFHYLLRSATYKWELQIRSKGVWLSRLQLLDLAFMDMPIVLPPPEEQAAIVRFLDHANRRIERAIRAKKKLIGLLNEQKQAIIHRTVTRGLDPSVPLKPSGIPWLGDIPQHWEVRRLKHAFKRIVGGSTPASGNPDYWNGDIVWVTPADVSKSAFLSDSIRRISLKGMQACSTEIVPAGSIILTSRAPVGNVALARVSLCTNQGCKALIPDDSRVLPMFGFWSLSAMKAELQSRASGTTFFEISMTKLSGTAIALPALNEQERILDFIATETDTLDITIIRLEREIELLREYRTRLIADVVTGKLDVREAAKHLPDETESSFTTESDEPLEQEEAEILTTEE